MTFRELIDDSLKKHSELSKSNLLKIIFFLSKENKNNELLNLNINNEIDFDLEKFNKIINKFLNKKIPLEYITKSFNFYNIEYYIEKKVFIPRDETEFLVSNIIKNYKNVPNLKVLDICSGSGCISNTLQINLKDAEVYGLEKKRMPFKIAIINKNKYSLKTNFIKANIFKWIKKNNIKFDLIICNPPYISKDYKLDKLVLKEPRAALFAGNDGLLFYEFIIKNINSILDKKGTLIFEIGFDQKDKLINILKQNNLTNYNFEKDQYGLDRNLYIKL
ncbi:MAG: peptide chain release factor N(5)-glutamine methyltransferase [Mycoplasmoidaceae bacterium]